MKLKLDDAGIPIENWYVHECQTRATENVFADMSITLEKLHELGEGLRSVILPDLVVGDRCVFKFSVEINRHDLHVKLITITTLIPDATADLFRFDVQSEYGLKKMNTSQRVHNFNSFQLRLGKRPGSDSFELKICAHLKHSPTNAAPAGSTVPTLSDALFNLYDSSDMADVTFDFPQEKKQLDAHKCILIARSPVFKAMLNTGFKENSDGKVTIPIIDITSQAFDFLLKYIYSGKLDLTKIDPESEAIDLTNSSSAAAKKSNRGRKRKCDELEATEPFEISLLAVAGKYFVQNNFVNNDFGQPT